MLHVPKESVIAASNVQNVMGDIMLLLSGAIEMSQSSQSTSESPSSGLKAESRRSALNLESPSYNLNTSHSTLWTYSSKHALLQTGTAVAMICPRQARFTLY